MRNQECSYIHLMKTERDAIYIEEEEKKWCHTLYTHFIQILCHFAQIYSIVSSLSFQQYSTESKKKRERDRKRERHTKKCCSTIGLCLHGHWSPQISIHFKNAKIRPMILQEWLFLLGSFIRQGSMLVYVSSYF